MCELSYRLLGFAWLCFSGIAQPAFASLPLALDGQVLPSLAPMLKKVTPAVVNISSARTQSINSPLLHDPFFGPLFKRFFEVPEQRTQSRGSGVIINAEQGYVITNHHVVEEADEIVVILHNARKFNAKLIGLDPETDIALLKIPSKDLTALRLADSDKLQVGDFVVAIGNPFGLGQTVTSGIVSALGRSNLGIEGYEDFIQTDASINPGNSGGALVDLSGELVGINTAIIAPGGGNVGIGFAIPVNMVAKIVEHLAKFGEVQRGVLGVQVQDLTPELADAFGLEANRGTVVTKVEPNSPAEEAGLKPRDIITAINKKPVRNSAQLRNRVGLLRVGENITLTILRKGHTRVLKAVIGDYVSVKGKQLSPYLAGTLLREVKEGIQVYKVSQNSVAWKIGFRPDDIILGVGNRRAGDLKALSNLMQRYSPPMAIRIHRAGEMLTIILQ
jgi:Do/DeqQ family serine protease